MLAVRCHDDSHPSLFNSHQERDARTPTRHTNEDDCFFLSTLRESYQHRSIGYFSGQFAVVKRVRELSTGFEFAAKFVRKKKCIAGKRGLKREEILREADILSELAPHANIITLHDVFENKHEIILVLELYVSRILRLDRWMLFLFLSLGWVLENSFITLRRKMLSTKKKQRNSFCRFSKVFIICTRRTLFISI